MDLIPSTLYLATCLIDILHDCYSSLHNLGMQTNVNVADRYAPNPHCDNYDRLSDTYVIRKTADADSTEEHCYICFVDWQIGHDGSTAVLQSLAARRLPIQVRSRWLLSHL
jgi:hypothetical protein